MSRKVYSIALLIIIALSLIPLALLTIPLVHAARGNPILAGTNIELAAGQTTGIDIKTATYNVSMKAGEISVAKIDGEDVSGYYFTIVFAINDTWIVSFDGSWFDLYISKDGYSALSADDIKYAGPFYVVDLTTYGLKKYTISNPYLKGGKGDFYIGKITIGTTNYSVVIGPIPLYITQDYKYIKVFDGLASQVAVTRATVEIMPTITLTPTWGPPGRMVTLTGIALLPNELINLTYYGVELFAQVWTDEKGTFSYTWSIKDYNNTWTGTGAIPSIDVDIVVYYNKTALGYIDTVTYTMYNRSFVELRSIKRNYVALSFTDLTHGAGNATLTVEAYVYDTIVIAGAWWNPRDSVKILIGGSLIKEVWPNETHGFFNTTFTVPELPMGTSVVEVRNAYVRYVFYINVLPTILLKPDAGYIGDTVEVIVYGFPANSLVKIFWDVLCVDTTLKYDVNIVNGTTGPDGKFNVTVTFKVPKAPGGVHTVSGVVDTTNISWTTFTILPRIRVEPSVFPADYSDKVYVIGEGLNPAVVYWLTIDNAYIGNATCDACGVLNVTIIGAGFRPGIHVASLYEGLLNNFRYYALFLVTPTGDLIYSYLTEIKAEIKGDLAIIKTSIGEITANLTELRRLIEGLEAKLYDIRSGIAYINTTIGQIEAKLDDIKPTILSINGTVVTINTTVGLIKATLDAIKPEITSIKGYVVTINTTLGTITGKIIGIEGNTAIINTTLGTIKTSLDNVLTGISDIKSTLATISSDIRDVKSAANAAKTAAEGARDAADKARSAAEDAKSGIADVKTLVEDVKDTVTKLQKDATVIPAPISIGVWLAALFSLIALILSAVAAASVRRKIAG